VAGGTTIADGAAAVDDALGPVGSANSRDHDGAPAPAECWTGLVTDGSAAVPADEVGAAGAADEPDSDAEGVGSTVGSRALVPPLVVGATPGSGGRIDAGSPAERVFSNCLSTVAFAGGGEAGAANAAGLAAGVGVDVDGDGDGDWE
jgi:hypothetical protein